MYIVIEAHGGPKFAIVCMDVEGNNLVFETKKEAEKYAEYCQQPVIVKII